MIEAFYPHETAIAAKFEKVLRQFCTEEHLPLNYEKKIGQEGAILFYSAEIAQSINKHYPKGVLDESVFADASQEDLLCYVAGSYLREGDDKQRAVFYMANADRKMHTVGVMLARLGCTHVRMYNSGNNSIPTSFVLLFTPNSLVKSKLGIQTEISLADLPDDLGKILSLEEEINGEPYAAPNGSPGGALKKADHD